MDDTRFDALARAVGAGVTRRAALTLLAGLSTGGLGLSAPEEVRARSRACKPTCGECKQCKKGKCKKKNGKKHCKKGKCLPKADGTACQNGGSCHSGACACPNGLGGFPTCTVTQVCQASGAGDTKVCFPQSTCPANTAACPVGADCGANCKCGVSKEGLTVCWENENFCAVVTPCTTSGDCSAGKVCVDIGQCCAPPKPAGTGNCLAACTFPDA